LIMSTYEINQRTVRVFISSTFRDMQEERDYLVKFTFPELRARCKDRQVEFVEVDLRWGITEEQSERGETLPRCLEIINICRPYFIGILGSRYGWVPDREQIPSNLLYEQPWMEEHLESSVTELEILHGVLNNPEMSDRAFFYFRDTSYIDKIPFSRRKFYVEMNEKYKKKLNNLKERIKASGLPVKEGYLNPKELGQIVLRDLWSVIDKAYPPTSTLSEIEKLASDQMNFIRTRSVLYTPRKTWNKLLDMHMERPSAPLVIYGESGIGKSALLANWVLNCLNTRPTYCLLAHFMGVSPESARPIVIQKRFIAEIQRFFHLERTKGKSIQDLTEIFFQTLKEGASCGKIILVIDALNQIEKDSETNCLYWMPETFPDNISVILSTTEGEYLNEATRRDWKVIRLSSATKDERSEMVHQYLKYYGKDITPPLIEKIISARRTANPLFLRVLLDELRIAAVYENLQESVFKYLKAKGVADLFKMVLGRWEEDYNSGRDDLVRDALSHLVVSQRGLSEREFLELLGDREHNRPLPQSFWSPFYLATREFFLNRSGYFWFFHDHLRRAVEERYVSSAEAHCEALFSLADFYSEKISRDREQGGAYRLLSLDIADRAIKVAQQSGDDRLRARAYLNCSGTLLSVAMGIGHANAHYFKRMVGLLHDCCELANKVGEWDILADALVRRAGDETLLNKEFGRYDLMDEAIKLRRKHHDWEALRNALRDKARIGMRLDQLDITEKCLKEADAIQARIKGSDPQWPLIHRHQYWGECCALQGRWREAENNLLVALKGARRFRHFDGINAAIGWLGLARCHLGDTVNGMRMVRRAMRTERDMLQSLEVVGRWLVELGKLFNYRDEFKRGLHALWLAEMIYEELHHTALIRTREVLKEVADKDKEKYLQLRQSFDPFETEFSRYCSLWGLRSFNKSANNPILSSRGNEWESLAVFNPTAWTDGEKIFLLYRAEGTSQFSGREFTSSIGIAESRDGIHFTRQENPIILPTEPYEIPGGCEDPRIVYLEEEKIFILTYTAYDGEVARLAMARTTDAALQKWEKMGPVFTEEQWLDAFPSRDYPDQPIGWSKSGALYNKKINGNYWMFFGDNSIWAACSKDLKKWEIIKDPVLSPRTGFFDSYLVEPGPPPIFIEKNKRLETPEGILLLYNGAREDDSGKLHYATGQVLLDPYNPKRVLRRSTKPILKPELREETEGRVSNVVFGEGLVRFKRKWFLYYGMADTCIGVAVSKTY